tara:strand:- start:97 stop:426 length:330 start_codon:yes stop_codon:yes gene_type:complete
LNIKVIKNKIKFRVAQTLDEISELKEITSPISPENAIGRISRMDAINNKTINDRTLRKAEEKLKKLRLALSRINDPKFGKCIKCDRPIQEARILLMPEEAKCVNCARLR